MGEQPTPLGRLWAEMMRAAGGDRRTANRLLLERLAQLRPEDDLVRAQIDQARRHPRMLVWSDAIAARLRRSGFIQDRRDPLTWHWPHEESPP